MITGEIKNQIDRIWDAFWSGGISNPLEVIEQITYLLFLRRLDDLHTLEDAHIRNSIARRLTLEAKLRHWRLEHGWRICPRCTAVHKTEFPVCPICRLCR